MSSKIILVTLLLSILFACTLANKQKVPHNSNFANGPWARIGKRKADNDPCNSLIGADSIDHAALDLYINCIRSNKKNSQIESKDSAGRLYLKLKEFFEYLNLISNISLFDWKRRRR